MQLRQVARDRAEEARPQRGVGVDVALGELGALHEVDDEALRRQVVQPRPEPLGRARAPPIPRIAGESRSRASGEKSLATTEPVGAG